MALHLLSICCHFNFSIGYWLHTSIYRSNLKTRLCLSCSHTLRIIAIWLTTVLGTTLFLLGLCSFAKVLSVRPILFLIVVQELMVGRVLIWIMQCIHHSSIRSDQNQLFLLFMTALTQTLIVSSLLLSPTLFNRNTNYGLRGFKAAELLTMWGALYLGISSGGT